MTSKQFVELKSIADGLHALGKPPDKTLASAKSRLSLMERFEFLLYSISKADRHELAQTLKDMLDECKDRASAQ